MTELNDFKEMAEGPSKENLKKILSNFHLRNGKQQKDGSLGEIQITPGEFRDALFSAYLEGISGG